MILLPTSALRRGVEVNLGGDELVVRAGMALAAGLGQVGVIDGRVRIAGGQNVVHAVTAGAVGDRGRADFRCHAVIAGQVRTDAAAGHAEFLREPHALVAGRAGVLHVGCGHGRVRILRRLDGVNAVAIGADRRLPVAARDGRAVNALHVLLLDVVMALGAGGRNVELVDRRLRIDGAQDVVLAVAVGADRGLVGAGGDRLAVHAFLVRVEGRRGHAARGHGKFLAVAGAAGLRECWRARPSIWDRWRAESRARCRGSPGTWRRWCCRPPPPSRGHRDRRRLADRRDRWRTSGFTGVGSCGKALMSAWQSVQPKTLWMEPLNLASSTWRLICLPFSSFDESRIAMAGQALVVAHLGRSFARLLSLGRELRNCRCHYQQQGSKENQTTALHGAPASIRDSTHRRTFQDRRPKHMGAVSVLTSACD